MPARLRLSVPGRAPQKARVTPYRHSQLPLPAPARGGHANSSSLQAMVLRRLSRCRSVVMQIQRSFSHRAPGSESGGRSAVMQSLRSFSHQRAGAPFRPLRASPAHARQALHQATGKLRPGSAPRCETGNDRRDSAAKMRRTITQGKRNESSK